MLKTWQKAHVSFTTGATGKGAVELSVLLGCVVKAHLHIHTEEHRKTRAEGEA